MVEKKKKKKLTKKEKLEQLRQEEEQQRLAEEARLREEEEERQRQIENARILEALKIQNLQDEEETLQRQKDDMVQVREERWLMVQQAITERKQKAEWQRYLKCLKTPNPRVLSEVNDFYNKVNEESQTSMKKALVAAEEIVAVIEECLDLSHQTDAEGQQLYIDQAHRMQMLLQTTFQRLTTYLRTYYEDVLVKDKDCLEEISEHFKQGMWINTEKNSRKKIISFPKQGLQIGISKQIAVGDVAIVAQARNFCEPLRKCTCGYVNIGAIHELRIVRLSSPCTRANEWSLRKIYPTQDPKTLMALDKTIVQDEELTSALRVSITPNKDSLMPSSQEICLGWWNEDSNCWSTEEISHLKAADDDENPETLQFSTTKLGIFSQILPVSNWLPYTSWLLQPLLDQSTTTVMLTIKMQNRQNKLKMAIDTDSICLLHPHHSELSQRQTPQSFLRLLEHHRLCILPTSVDSTILDDFHPKSEFAERLFCEDIGHICTSFLIASSKWNRALSNRDDMLCRIIEAEGTADLDPESLFCHEKQEGLHKVISLIRRGEKGIAFAPSMDCHEAYLPPPAYNSHAYADTSYGKLHLDSVCLLQAPLRSCKEHEKVHLSLSNPYIPNTEHAVLAHTVAQILVAFRLFSFG